MPHYFPGNLTTPLVLASHNQGKAREFSSLLQPLGYAVEALPPDCPEVEETGLTFCENALLKARFVAQHYNCLSLADDSGLCVDALAGDPGVFSARYAHDMKATHPTESQDVLNNRKLLLNLQAFPHLDQRQAHFACCLALCAPRGQTIPGMSTAEITAQGQWQGHIALTPKGDNGFGYDPIFFDPQAKLTAAQMDAEQKNVRSHRAAALSQLLHILKQTG